MSPPNPHVEVLAPRSSECGLCRKQVIADVISYEELVREQGDPHLNYSVILRKGETRTWKQHLPPLPWETPGEGWSRAEPPAEPGWGPMAEPALVAAEGGRPS